MIVDLAIIEQSLELVLLSHARREHDEPGIRLIFELLADLINDPKILDRWTACARGAQAPEALLKVGGDWHPLLLIPDSCRWFDEFEPTQVRH
jgi:hypothetical protein